MASVKVLRIHTTDIQGGAAIAIYRLHQALKAKGIDSKYLVYSRQSTHSDVDVIPSIKWADFQLGRLTRTLGFNELHISNTTAIAHHSFYRDADVLHLHNLHNGYFNYLALPQLTQAKPALLTLHDMWAFTGHCAYSFACQRWKTGCGQCPDLKTYPAIQRDSTHWQWRLKRWVYQRSNLKAIVTTSRWMATQAKQSILGHLPIYRIPPGLDTHCYAPLDQRQCRQLLGLPLAQPVVMAASDRLDNPRKGGLLLVQALNTLPPALRADLTLIILGKGAEKLAAAVDVKTMQLGFVESDRLKAIAYAAADIFLFPTCAENFGLVAQEAMACGTPTVAFDVGGVSDIVRPGITGMLAEPENVAQFRGAIVELLEDAMLRQTLGKQGREIVETEYSLERYAQSYIDLYEKALTTG